MAAPEVFLQFKGTDICFDFYCDCGASCHFDGYFGSNVICPHCDQHWVLPHMLTPHKFGPGDYPHDPKMLEPDERYSEEYEDSEGLICLRPLKSKPA
jgi:hypothetical protein